MGVPRWFQRPPARRAPSPAKRACSRLQRRQTRTEASAVDAVGEAQENHLDLFRAEACVQAREGRRVAERAVLRAKPTRGAVSIPQNLFGEGGDPPQAEEAVGLVGR